MENSRNPKMENSCDPKMANVDCPKKSKTISDWANLPKDLAQRILKCLGPAEYCSFSGVCTSWRATALEDPSAVLLPWIAKKCNPESDIRVFYHLSDQTKHEFSLNGTHKGRLCGSTAGWLILAFDDGRNSLLNPFSREQISLPSRRSLSPSKLHFTPSLLSLYMIPYRCYANKMSESLACRLVQCIKTRYGLPRRRWLSLRPLQHVRYKAVRSGKIYRSFNREYFSPYRDRGFLVGSALSSVPSSGNCVIAGLFGYKALAICRPQDEKWVLVEDEELKERKYCDLVFFKGSFYALDVEGDLTVFDAGQYPKVQRWNMGPSYCNPKFAGTLYLVESSGELLMVEIGIILFWDKNQHPSMRKKTFCNVYKLDGHGRRWIKIRAGDSWVVDGDLNAKYIAGGPHGSGEENFDDAEFGGGPPLFEGDQSVSNRFLFLGSFCSRSVLADDFPKLHEIIIRNDPNVYVRPFAGDGAIVLPLKSSCAGVPSWLTPNPWQHKGE